jgi:ParB family chromosome partitioning protein
MPRTALGRGLGSLLQEVESAREGLQEIPVTAVDPNPLQPRTHFPESRLKELSDSIRSSGVVQPILVRKVGVRFQIVAGERRWRAAKLAGLERVPAVVRSLSDRDTLQLALTENMMREDLNPLDVARGMEAMIQRFAFRHEEIAQRLGVDRSTVTNTLRLLKLPEEVQDLLQEGKLTPGHARALLSMSDLRLQLKLGRRIANEGLSVRQVENLVTGQGKRSKVSSPSKRVDPNVKAAVSELERTLGTKVQFVGSNSKGKILLWYHSAEDLDRLYNLLARRS